MSETSSYYGDTEYEDDDPTPLSPERAKEMADRLEEIANNLLKEIGPSPAESDLRQFAKELRNGK